MLLPIQHSPATSKIQLTNGITVVVDREPRFSSVGCVCCMLGGTRGEPEDRRGVTHALEHVLFRRTARRNTKQLSFLIDDLGGEINASTDAESLCLYGQMPKESLNAALSLFCELLCETAFDEEDVELEKEVIRQEILEAEDDPADVVLTELYRSLWKGSFYGLPVFGSLETVERLTCPDLRKRLEQLLVGSRLLFAISGDVHPDEVAAVIARCMGGLPQGERDAPPKLSPCSGMSLVERPVSQVHLALGAPWPSQRDARFLHGVSLATLLGSGMSSRLFQLLREEMGLVYDVRAETEAGSAVSSMVVTAALERENVNEALPLVLRELDRLRDERIPAEDLQRLKRLQRAQLAMEADRVMSRAWRALESELAYGRQVPPAEMLERFERITAAELQEVAAAWLGRELSLILCGDVAELKVDPAAATRAGAKQS